MGSFGAGRLVLLWVLWLSFSVFWEGEECSHPVPGGCPGCLGAVGKSSNVRNSALQVVTSLSSVGQKWGEGPEKIREGVLLHVCDLVPRQQKADQGTQLGLLRKGW